MTSRGSDKAGGYIAQLYEARNAGQWQTVPELARKVEKHAPTRRGLYLSGRAEALINQQPGVAGYQAADTQFSQALATVGRADVEPRDLLDAIVCSAIISFGLQRPEAVIAQLGGVLDGASRHPEGTGVEAWTAVRVLQGELVKGLSLESLGAPQDAARTYRSLFPYISNIIAQPNLTSELHRWTEEFLSHVCIFFTSATRSSPETLSDSMPAFRMLLRLSRFNQTKAPSRRRTFTKGHPIRVWQAYYEALSNQARMDDGEKQGTSTMGARSQLRAELRGVEVQYENLLLAHTSFPKADETNDDIRHWIELVMTNYRLFCGPSWSNADLGAGGKMGVAESTLDILYRAAVKTFHSTQLLRHLFSVHAYLGDYDLALKAFDSYVEIMTKGRARAAKANDTKSGIDHDDVALRHISTVILVCCRYGAQIGSEKAFRYGTMSQEWLEQVQSEGANDRDTANGPLPVQPGEHIARPESLSKDSLAIAYRAIAISQATWAQYTFNITLRSDLYDQAAHNLHKSLQHFESVGTLYALARVHAQQRNIAKALDVTKWALKVSQQSGASFPNEVQAGYTHIYDELEAPLSVTDTVPLYHLLALLLSSREDLNLALGSCNAALDQIEDILAGNTKDSRPGSTLTDREKTLEILTNGNNESFPHAAALKDLHVFAKQNILEAKMSKMALIDMTEGPEVAVNTSNELIALYTCLFEEVDVNGRVQKLAETPIVRPKSAAGTARSLKPRPVTNRLSKTHSYLGPGSANPSRLGTTTNTARTSIDNEAVPLADEHDAYAPIENEKNGASRATSIRKSVFPHRHKKVDGTSGDSAAQNPNTADGTRPPLSIANTARTSLDRSGTDKMSGTAPHPATLAPIPHNMSRSELPQPLGHASHAPKQDTRLPVAAPGAIGASLTPHLSRSAQTVSTQRFQLSLLARIWNFITGLYTAAGLLPDAKQASEEARRLVETLEADLSEQDSSVEHFQDRGWSGCPSLEELWADVYVKRGALCLARTAPHDALWNYEQALLHHPDHADATVALCSILLDIYTRAVPSERPSPANAFVPRRPIDPAAASPVPAQPHAQPQRDEPHLHGAPDPEPPELYRIAARDRAYGLLSALTRLGGGWDHSEAWLVLARAYEESGQVERAKAALWWTVELEDTKPVRPWECLGPGGFVLT